MTPGAKRRLLAVLLPVLAAGLGLAGWAFWWEPGRVVLREVPLAVPGWRPEHAGLRVAVLADLHVGSPHNGPEKLRRVVRMVNGARPDVVVVLGDLVIQGVVGGSFVPPEEMAGELRGLRAPLGVFAVLGNHDWWLDAPRVARALRSAGIVVVDDTAARVVSRGSPLWVAGVSDWTEGPHDVRAAVGAVTDDAPVLLLSHHPDVFPEVPARVSLTVAGHTHGGQVRLPVVGRPVVPSRYGERYAAGHVVEGGRHLFVGTGVGTSILPVRFRVPPEVVVLVLRPST